MSYEAGRPEKIWKLKYEAKMSAASIANYLDVSTKYVSVALTRQRRKLGLPSLGMPRLTPKAVKDGSARGRPKGGGWYDESPRDAGARVAAEVAAGKRCKRCHLLLPCFDHGERP